MKKFTYPDKPKKIRNAYDLLKFVLGIPADRWIAWTRHDEEDAEGWNYKCKGRVRGYSIGRCCVLGHLDNAYGDGEGRDGFDDSTLADVNNGRYSLLQVGGPPLPSEKSQTIKARVVKFLESKI